MDVLRVNEEVRFYSSSSYSTKIQYADLRFFDRRYSLPLVGSRSGMSDERPACSSRRDARGAVRHGLTAGKPINVSLHVTSCGSPFSGIDFSSYREDPACHNPK